MSFSCSKGRNLSHTFFRKKCAKNGQTRPSFGGSFAHKLPCGATFFGWAASSLRCDSRTLPIVLEITPATGRSSFHCQSNLFYPFGTVKITTQCRWNSGRQRGQLVLYAVNFSLNAIQRKSRSAGISERSIEWQEASERVTAPCSGLRARGRFDWFSRVPGLLVLLAAKEQYRTTKVRI